MVLLAASSSILVSHAKKRELLPDEGCGVLFLSRTFARHRRGARVTDKKRGSCAHKLRVVTHAQLLHLFCRSQKNRVSSGKCRSFSVRKDTRLWNSRPGILAVFGSLTQVPMVTARLLMPGPACLVGWGLVSRRTGALLQLILTASRGARVAPGISCSIDGDSSPRMELANTPQPNANICM